MIEIRADVVAERLETIAAKLAPSPTSRLREGAALLREVTAEIGTWARSSLVDTFRSM
jgi:hypothetical protein